MVDWNELREKQIEDKHSFYCVISGDKELHAEDYVTTVSNNSVVTLSGHELVTLLCDKALSKAKDSYNSITILCTEMGGTDTIVEAYANANNFEIKQYKADWDNNGKSAAFKRNKNMFSYIGLREHKGCLLLWNGENFNTRNLIWQAFDYNVPLKVFNYKKGKYMSKSELDELREVLFVENMRFM